MIHVETQSMGSEVKKKLAIQTFERILTDVMETVIQQASLPDHQFIYIEKRNREGIPNLPASTVEQIHQAIERAENAGYEMRRKRLRELEKQEEEEPGSKRVKCEEKSECG